MSGPRRAFAPAANEAPGGRPERGALERRLLELLRGRIQREAPALVEPFMRRLLALPDREMRAHALVDRLRRVDVALALVLLQGVLDRAEARRGEALEVLLDLTSNRPLVDALGYQQARALYELAQQWGATRVSRLFLSPEVLRAELDPARARPSDENRHLPDESLGRRKAYARQRDRLKLDRLLFDRNPQVIANLLRNPRITEQDVVRVAAMRPTSPEILEHVFRSPRWITRYRVKTALALNPHTPIDIALSLLPHLMTQDLDRVANSKTLGPALRDAARGLLRDRGGAPAPTEPPVYRVGADGAIVRELEGGDVRIDLDAIRKELDDWMA